jgi:hypothetical protein
MTLSTHTCRVLDVLPLVRPIEGGGRGMGWRQRWLAGALRGVWHVTWHERRGGRQQPTRNGSGQGRHSLVCICAVWGEMQHGPTDVKRRQARAGREVAEQRGKVDQSGRSLSGESQSGWGGARAGWQHRVLTRDRGTGRLLTHRLRSECVREMADRWASFRAHTAVSERE